MSGQRRPGLEVRKNFFSSRVTENWNKIPSHMKNVKKSGFKRSYKNQRAGCSSLEEKDLKARWRDGAQHEEDTPREVPAGLLGVQHQVSK
jgi:hypothetical protein